MMQHLKRLRIVASAAMLGLLARPGMADSGSWTYDGATCFWSDTNRWAGGVLADGSGSTAWFTNTITAGSKVPTVPGGVNGPGNLVLSNNGAIASGITLSTGGITNAGLVVNAGAGSGSTLISAVIGSNVTGLLQDSGSSPLTLSAANTYTGDTMIASNSASRMGGGMYGTGGGLRAENCTIAGNQAGGTSVQGGGGMHGAQAVNTVVVSNAAPFNPDYYGASCTFTNSCSPGLSGYGNLAADPGFALAGSGYGTNHAVGDCRLARTSPCINAGTNLAWTAGALDLAGKPRLAQGRVDMGACEQRAATGAAVFMR